MNNNYIVCHARKIKTAVGLANVTTHNARLNIYADNGEVLDKPEWLTNLDKAEYNEGPRHTPELILKRRNQAIKEAEKYTLEEGFKWRKPQKNAAQAIEFSISATPEWFKNKKPYEIKAYLDSCREFIANRYGEKNLLHWATHYDEKTPHLHILMTPLKKTDKGIKYSSSDFLGGKNGLQELQTEIYNAVGIKYGLNRGVEGSKARHTDQAEYAAKLKKLEGELVRDIGLAKGFKDFLSNKAGNFNLENGKKLKMPEGIKSLQKMDAQLEDFETLTPLGLEQLAKIMRVNRLETVSEAFEYQEKKGLKSIMEIPERRDNYISR